MSKIEEILNEKFGFTKNLPENKQPTPARMHDWVTDKNGKGSETPGGHPMEKYRQHIKALLGALDTEDESILENAIDWVALKRLAHKHGLKSTFTDAIDVIQAELDTKSPDMKKIKAEWEKVQADVPFWFLGAVGSNSPNKDKKELADEDKAALTNLRDVMDKISEVSGKEFKRAAKGTPDASKKTGAEKTVDELRKEHKFVKPEKKDEPKFPDKK